MVDDILAEYNFHRNYIQEFAKDFCIVGVGYLPDPVSDIAYFPLRKAEIWCTLKLLVNAHRKFLMIFTGKRKLGNR